MILTKNLQEIVMIGIAMLTVARVVTVAKTKNEKPFRLFVSILMKCPDCAKIQKNMLIIILIMNRMEVIQEEIVQEIIMVPAVMVIDRVAAVEAIIAVEKRHTILIMTDP